MLSCATARDELVWLDHEVIASGNIKEKSNDATRNTRTVRGLRAGNVCCFAHLARSTDLPETGIFALAWDIDYGAARERASVVVHRSSGMAESTLTKPFSVSHDNCVILYGNIRQQSTRG